MTSLMQATRHPAWPAVGSGCWWDGGTERIHFFRRARLGEKAGGNNMCPECTKYLLDGKLWALWRLVVKIETLLE